MRTMSLGFKLLGGVIMLVALMVVSGAIAYQGMRRMAERAEEAQRRLQDAALASRVRYWAIKQSQAQTGLIINQDPEAIEAFADAAEEFDRALDQLAKQMDTPEEARLVEELHRSDENFDQVFYDKVVPEIDHVRQDLLSVYDAESDALIQKVQEHSDTILQSVQEELALAITQSDDEAIRTRMAQLISVGNLKFWALKLYQNQADLIINQNLARVDEFEASTARFNEYLAQARQAADTDDERQWLKEVEEAGIAFDKVFHEKVTPEVMRSLEERVTHYDEEADALLGNIDAYIKNIVESLEGESAAALEASKNVQRRVSWVILGITVIAGALGLAAGVVLTHTITRAIRRVIQGLTRGSTEVSTASDQVSRSGQDLAQGASEQAASLEEISASLAEMTATTRQTAGNAETADSHMRGAGDMVREGRESMQQLSDAIARIKASSDETARIVKTIDEIAFQTNLLALNAAVEAARAGDSGKGFAVVAEEVRALAQRSAEAARSTTALIEQAQRNAEQGVSATGRATSVFQGISDSMEKVASLVTEISGATGHQSQGIEQINRAMSQMDQATQTSAAHAEESAAAAEQLSAQAQELEIMVGDLAMVIDGIRGSRGPARDTAPKPWSYGRIHDARPRQSESTVALLQYEDRRKTK